jgi:hypothetical protein
VHNRANKKFWEELNAFSPLIWWEPHRKGKIKAIHGHSLLYFFRIRKVG